MQKKNINGSALSFPQDNKINFEEASHTYTVTGVGEMTPVSNVVKHFFKEFDAEYWSMRKTLNDMRKAAILRDEWACNASLESQKGTHLHRMIEEYLCDGIVPDSMVRPISYVGNYVKSDKSVDLSKEWQYFENFKNNVQFTPFRTEWCVYDEDVKMAGTIDLICQCSDGTYELYDWKRSKKVDKNERNKWANGINGMEHLSDTSYFHYCLQQNLYRHMVESKYGLKISRMNLVVLHPEFKNYYTVPVPRMEREVEIIYNYLYRMNQSV